MKHNYLLSACILGVGVAVAAFIVAGGASAQALADVQYPVAELGGCADQAACKMYCDDAAHLTACLAFAEEHQLMSGEELQKAKQFAKAGSKGPGGCTSQGSCDTYCDDPAHIDACIVFAEQSGMLSGKELEEAKKVQAAIAQGIKPPACGGPKACDAYCSDTAHLEECITFSKAAGLMGEQESKDAEKMLAAVKKGVKPPACKGKAECDTYCNTAEHMEECMNFASAAGFMSAEEQEGAQKMLQALKKGVKPLPCKGKEECDAYCSDHMEECINFSEAAGMMTSEEAAMAKKTGGKGPGGCKDKEECGVFCNNPDNQQACFEFGRDNGMIPPEDLKKMEEGKKQFSESLGRAPTEVLQCVSNLVGGEAALEKLKAGTGMLPQGVGEKMGECFQQMMKDGGVPGVGGSMAPGGGFQPGPGAMTPGGTMMPAQAGPGGCKTPEECKAYCEANPDVCKNFYPAGGTQGMTPQPCMGENCGQPSSGGMGIPGDMQGMMQPGMGMGGQMPVQCAEGTNCTSPQGMPGSMQQPGMMPGTQPGMGMEGVQMPSAGEQQMQQQMQQQVNQYMQQMQGMMPPGTMEGGMMQPGGAPSSGPGGGGMMPQGEQQQQQQYVPPAPPPPSGSETPPAEGGGSLFNVIKNFLGL